MPRLFELGDLELIEAFTIAIGMGMTDAYNKKQMVGRDKLVTRVARDLLTRGISLLINETGKYERQKLRQAYGAAFDLYDSRLRLTHDGVIKPK